MIKNALKTFFKNLIYIFVPMGIIYLFFILIVFGLVSSTVSAAGSSLNAFFTLVSQTVDGAEGLVKDYFEYAFGLINWNGNFFDVLKEVLNTDWVYNTVVGFMQTLNVSVAGFEAEAANIVTDFVQTVAASLVVSVIALMLSVFFANFITRMVIRRMNARRGLKKKILALILQSTVVVAILGLTAYLFTFWQFSAAIMAVVYVIVISFTSLLCAWLIHGGGKVKFRKAVNFRNICTYFLSAVFILLICVAALALLLVLTNASLVILIGVPLIVYASNIIGVNADAYVVGIALAAVGAASDKENTDAPAR